MAGRAGAERVRIRPGAGVRTLPNAFMRQFRCEALGIVMEPTSDEQADDEAGMHWWNALRHAERRYWLAQAASARPADAWRAYLHRRQAGRRIYSCR